MAGGNGSARDLFDPSLLRGDGKCEMVIFTHEQKVIQRFDRPMLFVAYDPANMGEIVNRFLGAVKEAGFPIVINMPKRKITREQRDRMTVRALRVYRTLMDKNKPPAVIVQEMVDTLLSMVD